VHRSSRERRNGRGGLRSAATAADKIFVTRFEAERFTDAAPPVCYELNASDLIVGVNEAWQTFAVANGAAHLLRDRILGRPIWDFISDDATRLVYDIVFRQVRDGGRSQFEYRGDSPDRRRQMEMTIVAGRFGHLLLESTTVCVERHAVESERAEAAGCCFCKRGYAEGRGWMDVSAAIGMRADGPAASDVSHGMCSTCYGRVLNSVEQPPRPLAGPPPGARYQPRGAMAAPLTAGDAGRGARPRPVAVALPARHAS
jgi:hypothetical protein